MAKSELLFSGKAEEAIAWLNLNVDPIPVFVRDALAKFMEESSDDMIAKGAGKWAASIIIGKNRKLMYDSNTERPVLTIRYLAWPPIEMLEKHFKIDLQGKEPKPEHLAWIQENALQYLCGLIVEEGNDRKVLEFMTTFKKEDEERAAQAAQTLLGKFTKQGE